MLMEKSLHGWSGIILFQEPMITFISLDSNATGDKSPMPKGLLDYWIMKFEEHI